MSSPVSSNTNTSNLFFDEEFEKEVVTIMKKETQEAFQKTSGKAKKVLKKQVEGCAKSTAPCVTSPIKGSVNVTLSQPIASVVNSCITSSVDPVVEKVLTTVGNKSVDKCLDTTAPKIIVQGIDSSVDSTKSSFNATYNYIHSFFV